MNRPGASLIECLLSLAVLSFVMTAGVETFSLTGRIFTRLKEVQIDRQASLAAMDRIKADIRRAGEEMAEAAWSDLSPITVGDASVEILAADSVLSLTEDAAAGSEAVKVGAAASSGISAGRRLLIRGPSGYEVREATAVSGGAVYIGRPLTFSYPASDSSIVLIEDITYTFNAAGAIIRRKADNGTAQPLLENVKEAAFAYDASANLFTVKATSGLKGEVTDGFAIFPKNTALASER